MTNFSEIATVVQITLMVFGGGMAVQKIRDDIAKFKDRLDTIENTVKAINESGCHRFSEIHKPE